MSDRTRSEVWLHILGSILRGTDIVMLKEPAQIALLADQLEEMHNDRFSSSGDPKRRPPLPANSGTALAIVQKWYVDASSTSSRIMCIKELRKEHNWSLPEAKAFMDKYWGTTNIPCPKCHRPVLLADLGWSDTHKMNVCQSCQGGSP